MPRVSDRKRLLRELERCITYLAVDDLLDEDESDLDEIMEIYAVVKESRYLYPREYKTHKRSMADLIWSYSDRQFRQEVRMSRDSFVKIVRILEKHPIFKNNSRRKQAPPWVQCLVAFKRFGCFGNANSLGANGRNCGFSEGTVVNFMSRVTTAILTLKKEVIKWPDADYRSYSHHHHHFLLQDS